MRQTPGATSATSSDAAALLLLLRRHRTDDTWPLQLPAIVRRGGVGASSVAAAARHADDADRVALAPPAVSRPRPAGRRQPDRRVPSCSGAGGLLVGFRRRPGRRALGAGDERRARRARGRSLRGRRAPRRPRRRLDHDRPLDDDGDAAPEHDHARRPRPRRPRPRRPSRRRATDQADRRRRQDRARTVSGRACTAIGDSVDARRQAAAHWRRGSLSHAQVSCPVPVGRRAHAPASAGRARSATTVLIHLGTNGPWSTATCDSVMAQLSGVRVVFMDVKVPPVVLKRPRMRRIASCREPRDAPPASTGGATRPRTPAGSTPTARAPPARRRRRLRLAGGFRHLIEPAARRARSRRPGVRGAFVGLRARTPPARRRAPGRSAARGRSRGCRRGPGGCPSCSGGRWRRPGYQRFTSSLTLETSTER